MRDTTKVRVFGAMMAAGVLWILWACGSQKSSTKPLIQFTKIPVTAPGGSQALSNIEGRVRIARRDQKIVLFTRTDRWWVQPTADHPFTEVRQDLTWSNSTHLGAEYAALLVESSYHPPATTDVLPTKGGDVIAVAVVKGLPRPPPVMKTIHFSGYDWNVRSTSSSRGGMDQLYDPENAWTDPSGAMHFLISMDSGTWRCAEVALTRSLGYGTYSYVVRDSSFLDPAGVLSTFTWDATSPAENHREFGVELARWGNPAGKNAQFVVQPFYVAANVARFLAPAGRVSYSVRWQPDSLLFRAVQGEGPKSRLIAEHSFIASIPTPGNELFHMTLYTYGGSRIPLKKPTEVVVEKFEYVP